MSSPPAQRPKRDLYVVGTTSDAVGAHAIAASGALTPLAGSPFAAGADPIGVAVTPDGRHLYVANSGVTGSGGSNVSAYEITASGALAAVAGSPFAAGDIPAGLAAAPDGRHLYVANGGDDSVSAYAIADSGALTAVAGSPFATGDFPVGVAAAPDGRRLYLANLGGGSISAYAITDSGALIPVTGSPFAAGSRPRGLAATPDGRHLYAANSRGGNISAYAISDSGALTPVTGSPFAAGSEPFGVAATPDGGHLYAANFRDGNISAYGITASGALTPVAGSPFAAGANPAALATSPDGGHLYIARIQGSNVFAYEIAASGALSQIAGSPFASGVLNSNDQSLAITPGQPPVAAFTVAPAEAGQASVFDASATMDPDGAPVRFDWEFGDGTTLADGGATPGHVYATPGDYTATLTVTDDEGCSTERKYTGQTTACNGGAAARTTRTLTIAATPDAPIPELEITGLERDRTQGTATLTVAANVGGDLSVAKTKKVKSFGPFEFADASNGELEVVPRKRAAQKLRRTGRITVNPQVRFAPAVGGELSVRHKFDLRQD